MESAEAGPVSPFGGMRFSFRLGLVPVIVARAAAPRLPVVTVPIENPPALAAASVALAVAVVAEPEAAVAEPAAVVLQLEAEDEEAVAELALDAAEVAEPATAALDAAAETSNVSDVRMPYRVGRGGGLQGVRIDFSQVREIDGRNVGDQDVAKAVRESVKAAVLGSECTSAARSASSST